MPRRANQAIYLPIDALRGLLILLGILLHAARPYDGTEDWLVADQAGSGWLLNLALSIGFFRMPLFFFLSGLLAWPALARRSGSAYLGLRMVRLGVPLLFAAVLMNASVAWLLGGQAAMGDPWQWSYWINGSWLLHLWFLLFLLIYSAALVVVRPLILRLPRPANGAVWLIAIGFVASDFVALAVAQVFPQIYDRVGDYGTIYWLLHFGVYFVLGAAACHLLGEPQRITKPPIGLPLLILVTALLIGLRVSLPGQGVHLVWEFSRSLLNGMLLWCLLQLLMAVSVALARMLPRVCKTVADASYSIYLIHHSIVVAMAVALVPLALPSDKKFGIVVVVATAVSLIAHLYVVQRFRLLRGLINGKWQAGSPAAARAPAAADSLPGLEPSLQRSGSVGERTGRRGLQ